MSDCPEANNKVCFYCHGEHTWTHVFITIYFVTIVSLTQMSGNKRRKERAGK